MIFCENIKLFATKISGLNGSICGIDYGTKNIGIAISDRSGLIAFAHSIIDATDLECVKDKILQIIEHYNIKAIVIGLPKTLNCDLHAIAKDIVILAKNIVDMTSIPILLWDERMSTCGAIRNIMATAPKLPSNRSSRKQRNFGNKEMAISAQDDKHAAAYILQEVLIMIKSCVN